MNLKALIPGRWRWLILSLVLALSAVGVAGTHLYRIQKQQHIQEAVTTLDDVAQSKVAQISLWLSERRADANAAAKIVILQQHIRNLLAHPNEPNLEPNVRQWLATLRESYGYQAIAVYDPDGTLRLVEPKSTPGINPKLTQPTPSTSPEELPSISDLNLDRDPNGSPSMEIKASMRTAEGGHVGSLVLRIDPTRFLFPLARSWPHPSRSGETLLIRQVGQEIVYLTKVRHRTNSAMDLRISFNPQSTLLAALAVQGHVGPVEGSDYRGVTVVGAVRPIPDTPWVMIAKMDREEIEAPLRAELRHVLSMVLLAFLTVVFGIGWFWRRQSDELLQQRLAAEDQLRAKETRIAAILQHANDIVIVADAALRITAFNQSALRAYGYSESELIGRPLTSLRSPEQLAQLPSDLASFSRPEGAFYETLHQRRDGSTFPVEISGRTVQINGQTELVIVVRDITLRKHAELEIRRLNELYATLSAINSAMVHASNSDALCQEACDILVQKGRFSMAWIGWLDPQSKAISPSYVSGDHSGYTRLLRIQAADTPEGRGPSGTAFRERRTYVCNDFFNDPNTLPWREAATRAGFRASISLPLGKGTNVLGLLSVYAAEPDFFGEAEVALLKESAGDISFALSNLERDAQATVVENNLRESEERFRLLLKLAPIPLAISTPDGRVTYVNEMFSKVLGYSTDDIPALDVWWEKAYPDAAYRNVVMQKWSETQDRNQDRGTPIKPMECNVTCKDGSCRSMQISGTHLRECTLVVFFDLTQLRQTESQLQLQVAALDAAANTIVITDVQGSIVWANAAFTKQTGYSLNEAVGHNPRILKSGSQSREFYDALWSTIRNGSVWQGELKNRRKDGSVYDEEMTITPVRSASGEITHFIAIKQDISQRKQLEKEFLRAQRMEGVGLLAGGIAHDLNNVLAPILMASDLLRSSQLPKDLQPIVETIEACAKRGADIVKQVLTFARGIEGEKGPVQLRHLIRDMVRMATETFPRNIQIKTRIPNQLWPVRADATQLHQVLLNLSVNARDAMPNGGELIFSAENFPLPNPTQPHPSGLSPGDYVRLEVSDTGTGIPPEVVDRIFEPFFTTKEHGKGTGLGLSTVIGIIRSHGGSVHVESEQGIGSKFIVLLPALPSSTTETDKQARRPLPGGHNELILIVDDERSFLSITQATLRSHGFRTIHAINGVDALSCFIQHQDEVAAVITDVMMPALDGIALVTQLRRLNPDVRCIAVSGLMDSKENSRVEQLKALGVHHFIAKPFNAETLLETLSELLDERS